MSKKMKPSMKIGIGATALVVIVLALFLFVPGFRGLFTGGQVADNTSELQALLDDESLASIELEGTYYISEPLKVKGDMTLSGNATIYMTDTATQPEGAQLFEPDEAPRFGCPTLSALDAKTQLNMFVVESGASLTVGDKVSIDGNGAANIIYVSENAHLAMQDDANLAGAYYTNVANDGVFTVNGGKLEETPGHSVINNNKMFIDGGELIGAQDGAIVYSTGELTMNDGLVEGSERHNVYIAEGAMFNMTGGEIGESKIDNLYVEQEATAKLTGGTLSGAILHSIDSAGTVNVTDVTIRDGGIINNNGQMDLKELNIAETESHAIFNNGGVVNAEDIAIAYSFNYAVYNTGTMNIDGLVVDRVSENAIENGRNSELVGSNIVVTGLGSNKGALRNYGDMEIVQVSIDGGSHGLYNEGKVQVEDLEITNTSQNGIYSKGGEVMVDGLKAENIGEYGLSNADDGLMDVRDVVINDAGRTGIQNVGTMTADNVTIDTVAWYGMSNPEGSVFTGSNMSIINAGEDRSGIHNQGVLEIDDVTIEGARHGVYNGGTIEAIALSISNPNGNGIYNYGGTVTVDGLAVENTGEYGVSNTGIFNLIDASVDTVGINGVHNTGEMTVNDLLVENVGEFGISNQDDGQLTGANISIAHTGDENSGIHNRGSLDLTNLDIEHTVHGIYNEGNPVVVRDLTIKNTSGNGIYNNGGNVTIEGLNVNNIGEYGVSNTGTMDLLDVTVNTVGKNGVHNIGSIAVENISVENTGEFGISNQAEGRLTGTNISIANTGDENSGIHNRGELNISDITIDTTIHGIFNEGKLVKLKDMTLKNTKGNGIYNYGGNISVDGLNISNAGEYGVSNTGSIDIAKATITNVDKNGLMNTGVMTVNNVDVNNVEEYGISNQGDGVFTGTGIEIANVGADKSGVHNTGKLNFTDVRIDGAVHGIYNEGLVNAKRLISSNSKSNGIYNNGGNVTVDSLIIDKAGEYGISNSGTLSGKGTVLIQKISSTGINNSGTIEGMEDLVIRDVNGHGIYNNGGSISATRISVSNPRMNGIYNYDGGELVASDELIIENTGVYGISNADKSELSAKTIKISNFGINGAADGFHNRGLLTATSLEIDGTPRYGIDLGGEFDLAEVSIKNIASTGIRTSGSGVISKSLGITFADDSTEGHGVSIDPTGDIEIKNAELKNVTQNGVLNRGTITVDGLAIDGTGEYGISNSGSFTGKGVVGLINTATTGITNSGTINGLENLVMDNINGHGIYNNGGSITADNINIISSEINGIYNYDGASLTINDRAIIRNNGLYGISNAAGSTLSGADIVISNTGLDEAADGLHNRGRLVVSSISIDGTPRYGLDQGGEFEVAEVLIKNTASTGIRNSGNTKILERLEIEYDVNATAGHGIANDGSAEMDIANAVLVNIPQNGVLNSGTMTADGLSIDGTGEYGISNSGSFTGMGILSIKNTATTGIVNSGTIAGMESLVMDNVVGHGIYNNGGSITAEDISINNPSANGIYNYNSGDMTVSGIMAIENTGSYGMSNPAGSTYTGGKLSIKNVASNDGLHNRGEMVVDNLTIENTPRYGIDQGNTLVAKEIIIRNTGSSGIQNSGTTKATDKLEIEYEAGSTSGHGISNTTTGDMEINNVTVKNAPQNGVVNGGMMKVDGLVVENPGEYGISSNNAANSNLTGSDIHIINAGSRAEADGIYNAGIANLTNVTVDGARRHGFRLNSGTLTATNVYVGKFSHSGIYNNAIAEIDDLTIDGQLEGSSYGQYGINNQGSGRFTGLGTTTIRRVSTRAISNGGTIEYIENLIIDDINGSSAGHGIYNTSSITVGDASINNCAYYGIYNNGGSISFEDLLIDKIGQNGIQNAGNSTVSSQNIKISNVGLINENKAHDGVLNRGTLNVAKELFVDGARYGLNRGGNVTVKSLVFKNVSEGIHSEGGGRLTLQEAATIDTEALLHINGTLQTAGDNSVKLSLLVDGQSDFHGEETIDEGLLIVSVATPELATQVLNSFYTEDEYALEQRDNDIYLVLNID